MKTGLFVEIDRLMRENNHEAARSVWSTLESLIPLLFKEANPMPLKHLLWRQGLLTSPECRLPLTRVSPPLAAELDRLVLQTQPSHGVPTRAG
jgi:4-hydroxy-tetrahydrodipicolinate synthase